MRNVYVVFVLHYTKYIYTKVKTKGLGIEEKKEKEKITTLGR